MESRVRVASTPIPEAKTNLLTYVRAKAHPLTGEVHGEDEDGSVVIGKDASGTISTNFMEGVTAKTQLRSEAIAIGHNATVSNASTKASVQGIAIGWNAKAVGANALAIGSGAKHWYETDEGGDRTYAKGDETVAFGYCARATASKAVQIGKGINTEVGTLQFREWQLVGADGKIPSARLPATGGVDTNGVLAITAAYFRPQVVTNLDEIAVSSHTLVVYSPSEPVGDEAGVTATATRDYEIFLPDTENLRAGLPLSLDTDFDGAVKVGGWWTNRIDRLPALIRVREPVPGTCILTVETL